MWDLERLDSPISTTEAHHEMINCIDGIGGNGSGGGGFDGGGSSLIATGENHVSATTMMISMMTNMNYDSNDN